MLLTVGLRGTPSLCVLGSLYSLRGLEPAGHSCLHKSFVSVDFLSSIVVFGFCPLGGIPGQPFIGWILKKGGDLLFVVHSVENHSAITFVCR